MNPDAREITGLLLTPGAGGGADQHTLLALEAALDIMVRRVKVPQRAANTAAANFVAKQTHRLADDLGVATNEPPSAGAPSAAAFVQWRPLRASISEPLHC